MSSGRAPEWLEKSISLVQEWLDNDTKADANDLEKLKKLLLEGKGKHGSRFQFQFSSDGCFVLGDFLLSQIVGL